MADASKRREPVAAAFNIRRLIREARRSAEAAAVRPAAAWRDVIRNRLVVLGVILVCWAVAVEARLVYLQVIEHESLVARAERQQSSTVEAPAKRGDLVDRHGHVLAYSVDGDAIYAVPSDIQDADMVAAELCAVLDDCGPANAAQIAERLSGRRAFAYVKRQASPEEARRVAALGIDGIGFHKESRRYYPNRELASQLIGYVGVDNVGLAGVEATHDQTIRGRPGRLIFQHDARRRVLLSRIERPPTAGATVELTLDSHLQHVAERELRAVVEKHGAQAATAVIIDPHTGELLAMASVPTFNGNAFRHASPEARRNRAIQNIYEPGSTFKVITASAALMEQAVTTRQMIDTSPGFIRLPGRRRPIHDVHRYGMLSFEDVIVKSSNVGTVKVALGLGADALGRYARRFGFGRPTTRDLMGEESGIVWSPARMTESGLASMSIGYQVSVTPLQMAAAVSSIANGGELVRPRVVRAVVANGRRRETAREVVRRTVSPEVSAQLTAVLEQVVERGTLQHFAKIDGYMIAGKTGTPRRVEDGRYTDRYNPTVVGFAPSRNPRFTIVVVVESPTRGGYYGAPIAGPVFKRLAEEALRTYGVPPNINPAAPLLVAGEEEWPAAAAVPVSATSDVPTMIRASVREGAMPDLTGMSARDATRVLAALGLHARLGGDGAVLEQSIEPGEPVEPGARCTLLLGRLPPDPARGREAPRAAAARTPDRAAAPASAEDDTAGDPADGDAVAVAHQDPADHLGEGGRARDAGRAPR